MNRAEFRAVAENNRFTVLFQHGVNHIRTHHIATGKAGFCLPAIDPDEGFAEMHLLDELAGQRAHHAFTAFLVNPAQQDHLSRRLFQQMGDIAADGYDGDIAAFGEGARQQGVAAAVFDEYRFAGAHQRRRPAGQFTFNGEMGHHAGFNIFTVQWDCIAMGAAQIALLFQQIQILANGDL